MLMLASVTVAGAANGRGGAVSHQLRTVVRRQLRSIYTIIYLCNQSIHSLVIKGTYRVTNCVLITNINARTLEVVNKNDSKFDAL